MAGPPFQPEVDRVLDAHQVGCLIVTEQEPARSDRWSNHERALGLDRKFRVISLVDRPFAPGVLADLNALQVIERTEPGIVAGTLIPLATSIPVQPSRWAGQLIGLDDVTRGANSVTIAVLDNRVLMV